MTYRVLILGASYGSLFGTKLLMAGQSVVLVCTRSTADLINRDGTVVKFAVKGRDALLDVPSSKLPGQLSAAAPGIYSTGDGESTYVLSESKFAMRYRAPPRPFVTVVPLRRCFGTE